MRKWILAAGLAALLPVAAYAQSDVTAPGDPIVAIDSSGGTEHASLPGSSPGGEEVVNAIDNNTGTKYLNFNKEGSGLIVTPTAGPTVVTAIQFTTANDATERDPMTYALYGSNSTSSPGPAGWTLISSGDTGLSGVLSRLTAGPIQTFSNGISYTSYKLVFTSLRDTNSANSVQIAEVALIGRYGAVAQTPTLSTMMLLALTGLIALFAAVKLRA